MGEEVVVKKATLKDKASNYLAYGLGLLTILEGSISPLDSDASWIVLVVTGAVELVSWFTGKGSDLRAKSE